MAESQVPFPYTPEVFEVLTGSLSPQRLSTYMEKAGGDRNYAFALYLYNARLAKSLLFPLGVTEITLRNAVDEGLVTAYGQAWHKDPTFRGRVLTKESLRALNSANERAKRNQTRRAPSQPPRGKVIAELTFDFWSNLFRREYADLWRTKVNISFPNLPNGQGRAEIQALVREINKLRNRVAHHEHILDVNIPDLMAKMIHLTDLRCRTTSEWMRHHATAALVMRTKPKRSGAVPMALSDRSDPNFLTTTSHEPLFSLCRPEAKQCTAFICIDNGEVTGAFTHRQAMDFIAAKANDQAGMIDLNDHQVAELLASDEITAAYRTLDANTDIAHAVRTLQEPRTQILVSVDRLTRRPLGVMLRAHRRY